MKFLLLLCLAVPAFCARINQRIIGGQDAAISDYPYTLTLRVSGVHSCGAALIANDRALTAASCTGQSIALYDIVGGTPDNTVADCSTCVFRNLDWINRHPEWDPNGAGLPNDIAVLGFTAIVPNANVEPIALASFTDGAFIDDFCTLLGWGSIRSGSGPSQTLKFTTGPVISNTECGEYWGVNPIDAGHLCVYDTNSGLCDGDTGSPLECPGGAGNSGILAGIASWGEASCDTSFPSVYTRISNYYNWINEQ